MESAEQSQIIGEEAGIFFNDLEIGENELLGKH